MSIELITGFTGAPHIDSLEASKFNAAIVGRGDYVLEGVGDKMLKATMVTANKVHIDPGNGLMQGRHYVVDAAGVDLVVQTGTQGQKRIDLVVARYTKNATTGVEGVALVVLKGTPVASSPSDPVHTKGDILNGSALVADMPLWRIPLDGITVGAPVRLFDIYKSGADAWDSISRDIATGTFNSGWTVNAFSLTRQCGLVTCDLDAAYQSPSQLGAVYGTVPAGYRPKKLVTGIPCGLADGNRIYTGIAKVYPDGGVMISSAGITVKQVFFNANWPV